MVIERPIFYDPDNMMNQTKTTDQLEEVWHVDGVKFGSDEIFKSNDHQKIYVCGNTVIHGGLMYNIRIPAQYFMGIDLDNDEYVIYMYQRTPSLFITYPTKLCAFKDKDKAVTALQTFSHVKSHRRIDFHIYHLLLQWINRDISTHTLILSLLTIYGYNEDPRLVEVLKVLQPYIQDIINPKDDLTLSNELIFDLGSASAIDPVKGYLIIQYVRIYNILIKEFLEDEGLHYLIKHPSYNDRYMLKKVPILSSIMYDIITKEPPLNRILK